ncbi:MAG: patatin-like phospholipase family protein [Gemmatimonadota bacterium]
MGRTIVVFGGGGMKGLAHVGAWRALRDAGEEVDEIVGTSIGGLIGACLAGGLGWSELAPRALALRKSEIAAINRWALLVNGIRQSSVLRGDRFRAFVEELLPAERFDDLDRPLAVNAVDLETGRTCWFGAGGRGDVAVAEAVYASCALPVFYPPAEIGGRYYVDGGVVDALAVGRAAERGADRIVAVDVGAGEVKDPRDTVAKGMVALHHRVFDIMASRRRRAALEAWEGPPELVYVRPALDGYSTFDFANVKTFLEEGYRATRAALAGRRRGLAEAS